MRKACVAICLVLCIGVLFVPLSVSGLITHGGKLSAYRDKTMNSFGRNLAKKNDMKFLGNGLSEMVGSPNARWTLSLMSRQRITLEETRRLVCSMTGEFWNHISTHLYYKEDIANKNYRSETYHSINIDKMGIKVSFWDSDMDRYPPPYVSQFRVKEGKIQYFMRQENGIALSEPVEETLEEAWSKLPK